MKVTKLFRNKTMVVFFILCIGLLVVTAAELDASKPERRGYVIDEHGVPHAVTLPPVEGGISLADLGVCIILIATLSGCGILIDQQLLGLQQAGDKDERAET